MVSFSAIISLTLGIILFANVLMPTIKGTNTTGWTTSETARINMATT
jgi:hypothetical protein